MKFNDGGNLKENYNSTKSNDKNFSNQNQLEKNKKWEFNYKN